MKPETASTSGATAEHQSNNENDVATSRRIRQAITADKSLSTDAHNVKIITRGGHVLLKGPVRSEDEKKAVETLARRAAGHASVTSELEIAAH